jgi:adenylate cyclase
MESLQTEADNDRKLAEALSRCPNAVLGYFFLFQKEGTRTQNRESADQFLKYLSFRAYPRVIHPEFGKSLACPYCEALGISPNLPQFAVAAKNLGFFNLVPDSDGTVRRGPVLIRFQGRYYPSLDVAAALAYRDLPLDQVAVIFNRSGLERIDLGNLKVPADPDGYVQIDFYGPSRTFPMCSLADLVGHRLPPEVFRDRLVLIGPTAGGIGDGVVTPYQTRAYSGVEVHANFIENLLEGHFIRRGLREKLTDIAFILLFSLGAGALLGYASPVRATTLLVLLFGVFLWLAYYLFAYQQTWLSVILPTAALGFTHWGFVTYLWVTQTVCD